MATHLPMVYNVAGRAIGSHADIDDAVRETIRRAERDLTGLRDPASFRTWLLAITLRQTARTRRSGSRARMAEDGEAPEVGADFTGLAISRLGLSGQRRRLAEAVRWVEAEHGPALALWWLEASGDLSRGEVAAALRSGIVDTTSRIERMRDDWEAARTLVGALRSEPLCPEIRVLTSDWDRRPGPAWRRRIARHVRDCRRCRAASDHLIPAERLLDGLPLVPVPNTLLAALRSDGLLPQPARTPPPVPFPILREPLELPAGPAPMVVIDARDPARRPSAVLVLAGVAAFVVLLAGGALALSRGAVVDRTPAAVAAPPRPHYWGTQSPSPSTSAGQSPPASASISASPSPSPSRTTPRPSRSAERPVSDLPPVGLPAPVPTSARPSPSPTATVRSLRAINYPDRFVRDRGSSVTLDQISGSSARDDATFTVVPGLADADCVSLRTSDGRYLRHYDFRLRTSTADGSALFRADATFCPQSGAASGSVSLRSYNYPDRFVRHRDFVLHLDRADGSALFRADSSFVLVSGLS